MPRRFTLCASLLFGSTLFVIPGAADARAADVSEDPAVKLNAYKVKGQPITSFGISLRVTGDPDTRKVRRIFIKAVEPDSEAAGKGLAENAEILSVDGKPVTAFAFGLKQGSELGRVFIKRKRGDTITLVVVDEKSTEPRTILLTEGAAAPDGQLLTPMIPKFRN